MALSLAIPLALISWPQGVGYTTKSHRSPAAFLPFDGSRTV